MDVISRNKYAEFRMYKAKVVAVGNLSPEKDIMSRKQGVYDYIEVFDEDDGKRVSLQRVAVYLGCAPFLKDGQEASFIYAHSLDGTSVNAILAVSADGCFRSDYEYFFKEVSSLIDTLKKQSRKLVVFGIVPSLFISLPLLLWVWPAILLWGVVGWLVFIKKSVNRTIEEFRSEIPEPRRFLEMIKVAQPKWMVME